MEREFRGVPITSNEYGMREESYAIQKPAGTTRVVFVGDSFVFGYRAAAEDRLGVFLRNFLVQRGNSEEIECLHLAASSWNILAGSSYVRRQLHLLRPDLVVHVVVANDLDDAKGARGFGALGAYSPQVRERAGGLVSQLSPPGLWPQRLQTYLMFGLDHESRERYSDAATEISTLAAAVEAQGGRYLMLAGWESFNPMVSRHLASALRRSRWRTSRPASHRICATASTRPTVTGTEPDTSASRPCSSAWPDRASSCPLWSSLRGPRPSPR